MMDAKKVKNIVEACLLVAGRAMSLRQLDELFEGDDNRPDKDTIKTCIEQLQADYEDRGIELVQVASGYRMQSRTELSEWVARLFPEKPPRYSRALLETLVLVAYRQPITRGEIEEIRGVAVSSNIVKTLQERQWVKEVGFKDVPGKPALLGTTKQFLDYFNLKRLDDLPPLSEIKNLEEMDAALMEAAGIAPAEASEAANDGVVDDDVNGQGDVGTDIQASSDLDVPVGEDGDAAVQSSSAESPENDSETTEQHESDEVVGVAFAAGAANANAASTVTSVDAETHTQDELIAADSDAQQVVSDEQSDAPVTFAGLLSRLPSLDEASVESNSADSANIDQVAENSDDEVNDAETALNQPDAEEKLLTTLSEFAEEHQQEINARDELESKLITSYTENADVEEVTSDNSDTEVAVAAAEEELVVSEAGEQELTEDTAAADALGDAIDSSSASPEVLSETFTGESPSAGETLH